MKKCTILLLLFLLLLQPVNAAEFQAPTAPASAQKYMPENTESFSDGLWHIVKEAISQFLPNLTDASELCISLIAVMLLVSVVGVYSGTMPSVVNLVSVITVSSLLLSSANTFINLGIDTVKTLADYSKLLLPVMATATAAQGGTTSSAALFSGTTLFISILTTTISRLVVPLIYIFLCLTIANCSVSSDILKNIHSFLKWLVTWILKLSVYIFTGYMSITGVVCGTVDSSALKAAKLAMSGVVPVVGGVISDATESVLVGAGVMKNAAGVYGILATLSILAGPFLRVGTQYVLLKITTGLCSMFGTKEYTGALHGFCTAMGFVLAMIGTVSIMLLIGTVCFMKGVFS